MQCVTRRIISRLAYPTFGFWCLAITFYATCFPKSDTGPLTNLKFLAILFHVRGNDSFVTNRPRLLVSSHRDLLGTAAWGSSSALAFVEASKCNGPLTLPYHQTFCGVIFPESSRHLTVDILKTPFTIDACSHFLTSLLTSLRSCSVPVTGHSLIQQQSLVVPPILRATFDPPLYLLASRASYRSPSPHLPLRYSIRLACLYHSQEQKVRADAARRGSRLAAMTTLGGRLSGNVLPCFNELRCSSPELRGTSARGC
ncbi:hypothetical protein EDB87DRAFT_104701 [Lactarius vividus]|nr:hypothetical protein EDB87DRAFT_104701 [Lactarius vividus]